MPGLTRAPIEVKRRAKARPLLARFRFADRNRYGCTRALALHRRQAAKKMWPDVDPALSYRPPMSIIASLG